MARPIKEGMDYFSHDTDAVNDEKIEALRALFGNDGYAFYFIMLERIYRSENFEIDVSDAETRQETFQILSRKVAVNPQEFEKMLQVAFKWKCFCRDLYEKYGVITSKGIKKRAGVVLKKREEMRAKYKEDKDGVSDAETRQETREETQQRKEKDSKDSKENIERFFETIWKLYPRRKGKGGVKDTQRKRLMKIGEEQLRRCIKRFQKDMEQEKRPLDRYPYGSTFFNSGYVDYLDENYTEKVEHPTGIRMEVIK